MQGKVIFRMAITVIFSLWGQRCETQFDPTSELDVETWLKTCVSKGFIYPVEVFDESGLILYTEEQLRKLTYEY